MLNEAWHKNRDKKLSGGNSFLFFVLFKKCGGAKIKSFSGRLACRPFLCLLVSFITALSVIFWSKLVICTIFFTIGGNVWQICDGRALQHKCLCGAQNCLLPQNCLRSMKPRLLQMCCYSQCLICRFVSSNSNLSILIP